MILTIFGLAFVLPTAIRAIRSERANYVGHPFRTRVTTRQVRVSLQSQRPSSNPFNTNEVFEYALGSKRNENVFQTTSGTERLEDPPIGIVAYAVPDPAPLEAAPVPAQSSQTATTPPLTKSSTTAPSSGSSAAEIGTESASQKTGLTDNRITSSLGAKSTDLPALIVGSQTIKANYQNKYTLVHGQTSTPASTKSIALETLSTQSPLVIDSSSSHLSLVTATSAVSELPPLLAIKGQNNTASNPGHYKNKGQILISNTMATVSGTTISVAPKASGRVAAKSNHIPSANTTTTGSRTDSSGTNVPIFTGGVPGAVDGLWELSIALLVGIAVLLWL